jgi:hypothetical protein
LSGISPANAARGSLKLLAKKEMHPEQELMDALRDAEHAGHVAYTRYLCEAILDRWPNHGPTLIRYAGALIELALYEEAGAVLDRAEAVVPAPAEGGAGTWHVQRLFGRLLFEFLLDQYSTLTCPGGGSPSTGQIPRRVPQLFTAVFDQCLTIIGPGGGG